MSSELLQIIDLPKISDHRGSLTFIEGSNHIPFNIKRVYYLYGVPSGELRGGHAHFKLQQAVIAISGSFEFILENAKGQKERVSLDSPNKALMISNMTWREMANFSAGAVCLVLASEFYDERDYIRSYEDFKTQAALLKGNN